MGVPTRGDRFKHVSKKQGTGIWQSAMISHILTNETYTGIWHFGKTKMISDGKEMFRQQKPKCGLGKQVKRSRDEWIAVPVPALIDRSAFDKAQARIKRNKEQSKRNENNKYLLSRRLKCAVCGYACVAMTRKETCRYYRCNGAWQKPKVCKMPNFRVDQVDSMVWNWVKHILEHPDQLTAGLRGSQVDAVRANQALQERLNLIDHQIEQTNSQQAKLLDLYLSTDFPKEMLAERKARLEQIMADLQKERTDISAHLHTELITDDQIAEIESFCAEVRDGLDNATFEDKRKYIELLDVRGKLAIENDEKVVYIRCLLGKQRVSVVPTSPSLSTGAIAIINYVYR
jgi:site-specific DNA recombinase